MISAPAAPSGLVETNFTTSSPNVSFGASLADALAWLSVMLVAMTLGHSEGGCAPLPNLPPGRSASRRTATGWAPCVRGEPSGDCAGVAGARSGTSTGRDRSRGHVAFFSDDLLDKPSIVRRSLRGSCRSASGSVEAYDSVGESIDQGLGCAEVHRTGEHHADHTDAGAVGARSRAARCRPQMAGPGRQRQHAPGLRPDARLLRQVHRLLRPSREQGARAAQGQGAGPSPCREPERMPLLTG